MAIEIIDNFRSYATKPLDSRSIKSTLVERDAIPNPERFEGLQCYVQSEGKNYQLQGGTTNSDWVELGNGSSAELPAIAQNQLYVGNPSNAPEAYSVAGNAATINHITKQITFNSLTVDVFEPSGSDDTAAFIAYATSQLAKKQPIYFFSPTGLPFVFNNPSLLFTNNAANDYQKLAWIGIGGQQNEPPTLSFTGNHTLLIPHGIRGVNIISTGISGAAAFSLQGFSNQVQYELGSLTLNNSVVSMTACTLKANRIRRETATGIINVDNRSSIECSNIENAGTLNISGSVTTNWLAWTCNVQTNGVLRFSRLRTNGNITVTGNDSRVEGNMGDASSYTFVINAAVERAMILARSLNVTDNSGTSSNFILDLTRPFIPKYYSELQAQETAQTGNAINFNFEYQTRTLANEQITITSFTNVALGKTVRLEITSTNAADTFAFSIAGATIYYTGFAFVPQVPNEIFITCVGTIGGNKYRITINPLV